MASPSHTLFLSRSVSAPGDPQSPALSCRQALAFAMPSARNTSPFPPPPTQIGGNMPLLCSHNPWAFPSATFIQQIDSLNKDIEALLCTGYCVEG